MERDSHVIGFALLCSVTGIENRTTFPSHRMKNLKPVVSAFSRAFLSQNLVLIGSLGGRAIALVNDH